MSLGNFRALAGLEVKIGQMRSQHGPDMALTWSQNIVTQNICALDHDESVVKMLGL